MTSHLARVPPSLCYRALCTAGTILMRSSLPALTWCMEALRC